MQRCVKLSQEIKDKCRAFAEARAADSLKLYTIRGEARRQKIFADIFYGALAEYAVHFMLPGSTPPDLELYAPRQKSYKADLAWNGLDVHVKSQGEQSAKAYGLSWIFQKTDPLLTQPTKSDILALCLILDNLDVEVRGFVLACNPGLSGAFSDLRVSQYKYTKLALYFSHVKEYMLSEEELNEFGSRSQKEASSIGETAPATHGSK